MSDLSAQHYLGIYQTRLGMVEKGITCPKAEVVTGMRQLVAGLAVMDPDAKIRLEIRDGKALFTDATTGDLVAEIEFTEAA